MKQQMAILLLLGSIGQAKAAFYTGNEIHDFCQKQPYYAALWVGGFADAVRTSGYYAAVATIKAEEAGREILDEVQPYCPHKDVTLGQMKDVLCKALADNPQNRHYSAAEIARGVFTKAFPCNR